MERVVARLGRAHGLSGEVSADVRTDTPQERFLPGTVFRTDPIQAGPLTLLSARDHSGTTMLRFDRFADRAAAESLRGVQLLLDLPASSEPDAWYEDELVGLLVVSPQGRQLGVVVGLSTTGAQDLLVVETSSKSEVLVPLVTALVPVVDVLGGRIVVDPPGGLFDGDQTDESGQQESRPGVLG